MHHLHTCQRDYALARARWWMCTIGTGVRAADFDDDLPDSGNTATIDPADEHQWRYDDDRRQ